MPGWAAGLENGPGGRRCQAVHHWGKAPVGADQQTGQAAIACAPDPGYPGALDLHETRSLGPGRLVAELGSPPLPLGWAIAVGLSLSFSRY